MRAPQFKARRTFVRPLIMAGSMALLSACGGGEDASGSPEAPPVAAVSITTQPVDQSIVAAGVARFTITVGGDVASIQWQVSTNGGSTWTDVSGATTGTLQLADVTQAMSGQMYRARVIGSGGSTATSAPVTLIVAAAATAPTITVQAASARTTEGGEATFSVTAAGADLLYQWQVSTDGSTWSDVAGATSASLVLASLPASADGRLYRVVVRNGAGSVTSQAASLQVQAVSGQPTVLSAPATLSVVAPASASFSVSVGGTPSPTLQWQRSNDFGVSWVDVPGANAATYTLAATSTADTGALFRVIARNASGEAVSDAALLSVTAAKVAASVTTQPSAVTATVGGQATFTVTASGTPAPTLQWQVSTGGGTWTSIAGAHSATLTVANLQLTDSGKQYRVLATNSLGTDTSQAVALTVNPLASVLSGRGWTTGVALEADDRPALDYSAAIDDVGRAMVLFTKSNGSRTVLWAVRGDPGASGASPSFSSPVALDTAAPVAADEPFRVRAAPGGDMLASWVSRSLCTSSSYSTSGNCLYRYVARYVAATGTWEAPILVASTKTTTLGSLMLNDRGDMLVEVVGWERSGTSSYTERDTTVTWKAASDTAFRQQHIKDTNIGTRKQFLDSAGNLLLVGSASQNATTDIVAYRGQVASGMGTQEILDTRGAAATFRDAWMGIHGQTVVMWNQNNGTADTRYAATLDTPTGAWALAQMNKASTSIVEVRYAKVSDNGDFLLYSNGYMLRRQAGVWGKYARFNDWGYWNEYYADYAMSRNGNLLVLKNDNLYNDNGWASFDSATAALVQAFPTAKTGAGYLLGVPSNLPGLALLSESGVGLFVSINTFDVLPTPAVPAGDKRTIDNLWGFYFK